MEFFFLNVGKRCDEIVIVIFLRRLCFVNLLKNCSILRVLVRVIIVVIKLDVGSDLIVVIGEFVKFGVIIV